MNPAVPEGLLWLILAYAPLAFGCVEPWSLAGLEAGLFLLALLCALRRGPLYAGGVHASLLPAILAVLFLGVLQSLTVAAAAAPATSLPFTASSFGTARALLQWAAFAAAVWSVPLVLDGPGAFRRFAWALFLTGAAVAVVGILQRGQGNSMYYGLRQIHHGTPFGPYTNYNHAAALMNMSLCLGAGLFLSCLGDFRREEALGRRADLAAKLSMIGFLMALQLAGIFMTRSRGGLVALTLSVWLSALLASTFSGRSSGSRLRVALALSAAAAAAALLAYPNILGFAGGQLDDSTAYRLSMYRSGLRMLQDFPLFGVGLGALMSEFPLYQERMVIGIVDHLHSGWLELAVEAGLLGLAFYLAGLGVWLRRVWRSVRTADYHTRCLAGGAMAAILAYGLHDLVEFNSQIPANAVVFLMIVAALSALVPAAAPPRRPAPWARPALCAIALAAAGIAAKPAVAFWHSMRAEGAEPETRAGLLARSYRWDPDPQTLVALARAEQEQARSGPTARLFHLRRALENASQALAAVPLDRRALGLQAELLSELAGGGGFSR